MLFNSREDFQGACVSETASLTLHLLNTYGECSQLSNAGHIWSPNSNVQPYSNQSRDSYLIAQIFLFFDSGNPYIVKYMTLGILLLYYR